MSLPFPPYYRYLLAVPLEPFAQRSKSEAGWILSIDHTIRSRLLHLVVGHCHDSSLILPCIGDFTPTSAKHQMGQ
jgi:hypothetical protein